MTPWIALAQLPLGKDGLANALSELLAREELDRLVRED